MSFPAPPRRSALHHPDVPPQAPGALHGWRFGAAFAAVFAAYSLSGELGLSLAAISPQVSPVWPPTAVALAAVLLLGGAVAPAVALGALLVNYRSGAPLGAAVGIGVGNMLEALLGAWLLRRSGFRPSLSSARDVLLLAGLAAALSTTVSATIGVLCLRAAGLVQPGLTASAWWTWWLGDAMGDLVFAPLLLTLAVPRVHTGPTRRSEAVIVLVLVAVAGLLVFVGPFGAQPHLSYLVAPLLVWSALRLDQPYTAAAVVIAAALAIWGARREAAGLTGPALNQRLLLLQTFLGVMSVASLALGAVEAERRRALAALRRSEEELRRALQARTEAEQRLAAKTADLVRSNADLEDFAYIASHDLKEPLRGIGTYSAMLLEDCGDRLDDAGRSKLHTLRSLSARLDGLIGALLEYSRLGRTELAVARTELGEVVADVLESLSPRLEQERAEVVLGPLPAVRCDRHRLHQVFANLITNALKYNESERKRIEIGALDRGPGGETGPVIFVRDNGIGIPAKHLPKMFRMFKRLHAREAYGGGTGAGLAIVKNIVERHGGRIWCESTPGSGTTFYFTLGEAPDRRSVGPARARFVGVEERAEESQPGDGGTASDPEPPR